MTINTPSEESENQEDNRPSYIKNNEVGKWIILYNNKPVKYTIVKKEMAPKLKWFLWYPWWEHLFISEEVPEKFREPQLIHEIVEFTELQWKKWRCLQSLKYELSLISEEIWNEYIEYRRDFFERLIEYYKNIPSSEKFDANEFREEIQKSYEHLVSLKKI